MSSNTPKPTSSGRYNAHDTTTVVLTSIFCPLALLAIILRFTARIKTGAKLWWDDATAVLTLILYYVFCAINIWSRILKDRGCHNADTAQQTHKKGQLS